MIHSIADTSSPPPVRLGRISFINVDPIYYGFDSGQLKEEIRITSAPPAELNRMMADGLLDISAVSSAAYGIHHREWLLLPDFCIACRGDVMSVLLVSRTPLEDLDGKKVLVTDESATAVRLMRLMFSHGKIAPRLQTRKIQDPSMVDADAALVIGDAALRYNWHQHFDFVWDLGDLWARHANLPFVFAVWAVRKEFAVSHPERVARAMELLSTSRRMGLSALDKVVETSSLKLDIAPAIVTRYFNNFIFALNHSELSGMAAFFDDLYGAGIFSEKVLIRFFGHP
jgi:chorismate dehydratase